jgi:hypothetical protein
MNSDEGYNIDGMTLTAKQKDFYLSLSEEAKAIYYNRYLELTSPPVYEVYDANRNFIKSVKDDKGVKNR